MELLTQEEANCYITPERENIIRECITLAIDEYLSAYAELRHKHSTRTDANIIHDLIVWNVKNKFQDEQGAIYGTKRNCFKLVLDNAIVIRFKKLNYARKAQKNCPSSQLFGFEQLSLVRASTNLNAGYQQDGLDIRVFITCPVDNKSNLWEWELNVMPVKPSMPHIIPPVKKRKVSAKQVKGLGTNATENQS